MVQHNLPTCHAWSKVPLRPRRWFVFRTTAVRRVWQLLPAPTIAGRWTTQRLVLRRRRLIRFRLQYWAQKPPMGSSWYPPRIFLMLDESRPWVATRRKQGLPVRLMRIKLTGTWTISSARKTDWLANITFRTTPRLVHLPSAKCLDFRKVCMPEARWFRLTTP